MQTTRQRPIRPGWHLRLVSNDHDLARHVLDRAEAAARKHWQTVPLGGFRCFQLVNRGLLPYAETWKRLQAAAIEGGARESWVNQALYHAVSNAKIHRTEPPELRLLAEAVQ